MKRAVATIGPDASLAVAACKMRDHDIGCPPVVDGERLFGIITDRDIVVRGVAAALDPHRATVREAMSTIAIAGSPDQTVEEEMMEVHRIVHVPVVDRRGRLVGLVSLSDLTGRLAKFKPHQVTFYKRLATSSGHVDNVEVGKIYLSPAIEKENAMPAALAKFADDRGLARWEDAADLYEAKGGG
jgi:CBS-domain-containing membrane protein